jgi:hypothetical protein
MTAFERLRKVLTPKDNLLVFYAGHGFWEDDMQQGFWLPSDADPTDKTDWISNSDIRDYIKGIKARHTFLIVDACFGGAIFQMRDIGPEIPRHLKDLFKYPSRTALTSGTLNAVPDKSEFVTYLVKDLAQNRETYLTATELCTYLSRVVPGNSVVPQTPKYGTIVGTGDQNFGDFVFIHR